MVLFIIIIGIFVLIGGMMVFSSCYRSDPHTLKSFDTTNPWIEDVPLVSAHRSGSGIAPEETMMAFRNIAENADLDTDLFEFDLHITKDDRLVLLHDDTLDRTSDSVKVFGETNVHAEDKTYDELRLLNMGARFTADDGSMPYAGLEGSDVPDDLRILDLETILSYLEKAGDYRYIIEIKDKGESGIKAVDILYNILTDMDILDKVIFGTFNEEISMYVDEHCPGLVRSATINEVLKFWMAALTGSRSYEPPCRVLQIPFCSPYLNLGANLGTTTVINYAHEHNMAVQYWTVNEAADMEYLTSIGADCLISDYPDEVCRILNR